MNAPANLSTIEQLRARDGDKCWLCGGKLDFKAEPNSSKARTREHLLAQSLGGTNDPSNLVLCHPGCNKQLGVRPVAEKLKMRRKRQDDRAKLAASQKAKKQTAAMAKVQPPPALQPELKSATAPPKVPPPSAARNVVSAYSQEPSRAERELLLRWQIAALVAGGLALLFLGFSLGLLVG